MSGLLRRLALRLSGHACPQPSLTLVLTVQAEGEMNVPTTCTPFRLFQGDVVCAHISVTTPDGDVITALDVTLQSAPDAEDAPRCPTEQWQRLTLRGAAAELRN